MILIADTRIAARDAPAEPDATGPGQCAGCGRELPKGRPDRRHCDGQCRSRAFRKRARALGRKRAHRGAVFVDQLGE